MSGRGLFGNESLSTLAAFVDQTGTTFPILRGDTTYFDYGDPEGTISPYPLDVIIDQEGKIAYLRREFDANAMRMTIDRLLAQ